MDVVSPPMNTRERQTVIRTPLRVVVTLLVAGFVIGIPTPPHADALVEATGAEGTIDLFVEQGPLAAPGDTITVRVTLRASEGRTLQSQAVRLSMTEEPLESETQLRRFLTKEADLPVRILDIRENPVVLEQETGDVRIDVELPEIVENEAENAPRRPVLYGLQADFLESVTDIEGDALLSQRQAIVIVPRGQVVEPALIAPIVTMSVPATGGRTLTAAELESYTAPGNVLHTVGQALLRYPATVAVDSRITLSIEAAGEEAPGSAKAWSRQLSDFGLTQFALPWADTDPLATLAIDTLLYSRLGQYPWLHSNGVTEEQLLELAQRSADAVLVPSSIVESDRTVVQFAGMSLIRVDTTLSGFVEQAAVAPSDVESEAAMQRVQALVAQRAATGLGEVLVFDTGRLPATATALRIESVLRDLYQLQLSQVVPVPFTQPPNELVLSIQESPPTREWSDFVSQVRRVWESDVAYVTIADNPEAAIGDRWNRYQALFSASWESNPDGQAAELERAQSESEAFQKSVFIEQGSALTVLADRTELPVTVRNTLPSTVRVVLNVQPSRAIVTVENPQIPLTLGPDSVQRVSIPVRSLANGTVPVTLTLLSPTGEQVGDPLTLSVTIRAGWEGVITTVLAVAVGAIFAFGVYRAIQRRRSEPAENPNKDVPGDAE